MQKVIVIVQFVYVLATYSPILTVIIITVEFDAYSQYFKAANKSGTGVVSGQEAIDFFAKSNLSPNVLSEVRMTLWVHSYLGKIYNILTYGYFRYGILQTKPTLAHWICKVFALLSNSLLANNMAKSLLNHYYLLVRYTHQTPPFQQHISCKQSLLMSWRPFSRSITQVWRYIYYEFPRLGQTWFATKRKRKVHTYFSRHSSREWHFDCWESKECLFSFETSCRRIGSNLVFGRY